MAKSKQQDGPLIVLEAAALPSKRVHAGGVIADRGVNGGGLAGTAARERRQSQERAAGEKERPRFLQDSRSVAACQ